MTKTTKMVVVGLGEVGKPMFELLSSQYDTVGLDISPPTAPIELVGVLHICYPFQIKDFVGETARYIDRLKPELTVINSTVAVGTTRAIGKVSGAAVVNSPVRGKHARMSDDLKRYVKFIGAIDRNSANRAAAHFETLGLETKVLSSPEATELAKLTETTYFGLMIAWAQQVERYCDLLGTEYSDVASFYDEIEFFPKVKYFPGIIGGHCVMPNIEILSKLAPSVLLEGVCASNRIKMNRDLERGTHVATAPDHLMRPSGVEL